MDKTENKTFSASTEVEDPKEDDFQEFLQGLPTEKGWQQMWICKFKGVWYPRDLVKPALSFRRHYQANDTDIILCTLPKCGTTWLKALVYSMVNRNQHSVDQSPLLNSNPHALVPFLEIQIYAGNQNPDLECIPCPRILSTHMNYEALPDSILNSKCKIIYICRNPLDKFVSHWHYISNTQPGGTQPLPIVEAFEYFIQGIESFGPFWVHMLGYWNASLKNPQKILFLKYDLLRERTVSCVKNIAEFMGFPFSEEEERKGLIEEIIKLCSFEKLRNLEANKSGELQTGGSNFKNKHFFRKGEVGDWVNYFTPCMAERVDKLIEEKLQGSGLTFEPYCKPPSF